MFVTSDVTRTHALRVLFGNTGVCQQLTNGTGRHIEITQKYDFISLKAGQSLLDIWILAQYLFFKANLIINQLREELYMLTFVWA